MAGSWKDGAEYAVARAVERVVRRMPDAAAERVGASLGRLIHSPLRIRRRTVEENLLRAFPDRPPAWRARVAREAFRHLGREALATLRLSERTAEEVLARVDHEGGEALQDAWRGGRGAILVTGHFGNWEVAAAAVAAAGLPLDAVVKPLRNRRLDAELEAMRGRLGIGTIPMDRAAVQVKRSLQRGRLVALVADQDAGASGAWVPFFGHPASTHRGPALFALRFDVPLFHSVVVRLPDGRYHARVERVEVERSGDPEADVERLTARLAALLEAAVREVPEQYFWFHKRWKTRPPDPREPA